MDVLTVVTVVKFDNDDGKGILDLRSATSATAKYLVMIALWYIICVGSTYINVYTKTGVC